MAVNEHTKLWEGVYESFAEAKGDEQVFHDQIWLGKIAERARLVCEAAQGTEAIPEAATTHDYALAFVAPIVARPHAPLRILDFGGGLATSFVPLTKMLPKGQPLDYVIVENAAVVDLGRRTFEAEPRLSFRDDMPGAGERFDIIHCGSSLHYVDDWVGMLHQFAALQPRFLLLVDLPASDNRTFVTTQHFHHHRIPVRFWNLSELIERVEAVGFSLVLKSRFIGYHASMDLAACVANFASEDRLRYFSQLIFRNLQDRDL